MDNIKLPPHSIDAERSVLGGLLLDLDAIDRIGDLVENDFYNLQHRLIFSSIRKDAAIGKQYDVITIAEGLQKAGKLEEAGGLSYIGSIVQETPSAANIRRYAAIVKEYSQRRKIISAANELAALSYSNTPINEALDITQKQLLNITDAENEEEPLQIGAIISSHLDTIDKRLSAERKGITTGLIDLDNILNGGWHRGQLIILAARPSMGKTAKSLHNAIQAAIAGYGVLYISMEMVAAELADRALASIGRIDLGNILTGKLNNDEWSGLTYGTSKLYEIPLHVMDKPGLNFYQVSSYARKHKRKFGMDMLVVDYLQLMSGSEKERHSQIENITRNLKVLAKELNIAIVLLSQLSRKAEDSRRPKLSHLRDSGSIEQDADVVIFIHREEVDNPDTTYKNYADIYIAKQRQGALGRVGVTYIGHQVRFESFSGALPSWDAPVKTKRGME